MAIWVFHIKYKVKEDNQLVVFQNFEKQVVFVAESIVIFAFVMPILHKHRHVFAMESPLLVQDTTYEISLLSLYKYKEVFFGSQRPY